MKSQRINLCIIKGKREKQNEKAGKKTKRYSETLEEEVKHKEKAVKNKGGEGEREQEKPRTLCLLV